MARPLTPEDDPGTGEYAPLAAINVTPMVDVMLVLLVIFMVTAPLLSVAVPLDLPKSRAAALVQPRKPIILSLDRQGKVFIGDEPVTADALQARLAALAAADPDRIVYVRGDRRISYAQLMDLLGRVSHAGFAKVSLLAEPPGRRE
ncbi:MAG TPA: ExbD/TolR family protein [Stellaceae bacterium]|nr:ExbD/TolR family protein [Stellaceae bacterium]